MPLEQAIPTLLEPDSDLLPGLSDISEEARELGRQRATVAIGASSQVAQRRLETLEQFARARHMLLERGETLVIPPGENIQVRVRDDRNVDVNVAALTYAVEAPNTLLDETWIDWQVEQHEMMRELEVAALAADFGADQEPRAVGIRERGRTAIALNQRQVFVKGGRGNRRAMAKGRLDGNGLSWRLTDEQHLFRRERLHQGDEPIDAWVVRE